MNLVVRLCGLIVLALGTAATVAGLALPWTMSGGLHPDLTTIAGIAFLGPLLGLLCLAYARHDPRRFRLVAAVAGVAAVAALLVAVGLARLVSPSAGVAVGGPLAVVGSALAVLGWLLLLVAGPGRITFAGRRSWLAAALTVALALLASFVGIDWAREGRFVDATTAGARPAGPAPAWPLQLAGVQLVGVHEDLVILRGADGIRAVWLGSGTTAWQYLRSDLPSSTAGLVDGAVVVVFGTDDGILVTALDAGSGAERFSRRFESGKMATVRAAGRIAVLSNLGIGAGDLLGIDARDGALRWRWTPERNGGPCDVTDLASTSETVAVAMRCRATGVDDMAVGLTADGGAERWSWHAIQRTNPELRVFAVGAGFVTVTGVPHRATYMDAVTGSVGARHDAAGALALAAGTTVLYAEPSADRPHLAAVDARTGGVKWDVALPGLGGHQPLTGAADDGQAHLLWRSPDGALRLLTVTTENGAIPSAARTISCPAKCPDTTAVAAGSGHTAVTVRDEKATTLYLTVP
ncbi:PQQ-binding-like beta-propeller repeat protein [Dactylosporangium sucinum]|uniref:Pyrrolo-quinoline quinone repeat domain-containing protein n=1 Tax=Dactylosporangium sucinum TaxID=1424081 RepID=A0A917TC43_9ACTN|nr:PQQ-binding-like beta-propeller repeat protein [Dactylosporangium sucinum]GGM17369.1 hypothetical protein GCM10007977_018220 [Dactylosporangium sucinum]